MKKSSFTIFASFRLLFFTGIIVDKHRVKSFPKQKTKSIFWLDFFQWIKIFINGTLILILIDYIEIRMAQTSVKDVAFSHIDLLKTVVDFKKNNVSCLRVNSRNSHYLFFCTSHANSNVPCGNRTHNYSLGVQAPVGNLYYFELR